MGSTSGTTSSGEAALLITPTAPQTKICVYCGASPGHSPAHMAAARDLATVMAARNIGLVYGGGTVGLMGELAKTLVSLSGPDAVHGIIPEALLTYERDTTYKSESSQKDANNKSFVVPEESTYGRTTVVKDMHSRKNLMAEEVLAGGPGSGFIAMSGGYGTLEEVIEACTWNQLGIHNKGVVLLNIDGFYDGIITWIEKSVQSGFIKPGNAKILVSATTAEGAVKALEDYQVAESRFNLVWGKQ